MKKTAIIFFLVFILAWNNHVEKMSWVPFNWLNIPVTEELGLIDYPKTISGNLTEFSVYSSKNKVCSINFCGKTLQKTLQEGYNKIEISVDDCSQELLTTVMCDESRINFYSEKINMSFAGEDIIEAKLATLISKRTLELNVTFNSKLKYAGYKNFDILLDGRTILHPTYLFPSGESEFVKSEELNLEPGIHTVEIAYKNITLDTKTVSIQNQPFPLATLLDVVLSLTLALAIYRKYSLGILTSFLTLFGLFSFSLTLQFQLQKKPRV